MVGGRRQRGSLPGRTRHSRFRAKMRLGKLREPTVFNRQATEYRTVNKTGRTVTLGEGNDFLLQ